MSFKRWVVSTTDKDEAAQLAEDSSIHPFLIYLLTMRGIHTVEEVSEFLLGGEWTDDPMAFADMDKAVERIRRALADGETIAVFGDYDADGVTATVLLYSYLRDQGARVSYLVPEREGTGYGMHPETVDELAARGVTLIITVDNGIAAVDEVAYAAQKGIDVVVTDHHRPQEILPEAVAVVNPHRADCPSEWKEYAGVGVAFKLICALEEDAEGPLADYADLVALGTLADVMPLRQENRMLVRAGLRKLNENPRLGLAQLGKAAGMGDKPFTASSAVFTLAPRINAAGRMGSADKAVQLLLAEDVAEAATLAAEIQQMNVDRQTTELEILQQVDAMLLAHPEWRVLPVLVICGENWHSGVIGIIAARITERYGKPCILFSVKDGVAKGSGRSIKGFSLFEAIAACEEVVDSFGGHELAAGVTLAADRIDDFRQAINRYAAGVTMPTPTLEIDCKLRPSQVDVEKLGLLAALEPTGTGNPAPLFGLYNMRLDNIMPVGNGRHLRLSVSREDTRLTAMKFQTTTADFSIPCGTLVHLAVSMERNEYHGVISPSLIVKDIRPAALDQERMLADLALFEKTCRREWLPAHGILPPTREELGAVYRFLRSHTPWNGPVEQLWFLLSEQLPSALTMLLCLQVLQEAGLINWQDKGHLYTIETPKADGKTDLMQTPTMQYINEA